MSLKSSIAPLEQFRKFVEKVPQIGWDYDKKDKNILKYTVEIAKRFGTPIVTESRKGYHMKIKLHEPVTLARSFEIRYYLQDDYHRLCRDMLKAMNGYRTTDVLFDLKTVKRKNIFE